MIFFDWTEESIIGTKELRIKIKIIKLETEKLNKLLIHFVTDDLIELNILIYVRTKVVSEK